MVTPREDAMARTCLRQSDKLRHDFLVAPHRLRYVPTNIYHSLVRASVTWRRQVLWLSSTTPHLAPASCSTLLRPSLPLNPAAAADPAPRVHSQLPGPPLQPSTQPPPCAVDLRSF